MQARLRTERCPSGHYRLNPVDNLAPLAKAKIALLHVCGDADDVVPIAENTLLVKEGYEKLGGTIQVIVKPGVNHHPHSLRDPTPIVEFIVAHTPGMATAAAERRRTATLLRSA